MTQPEQNVAVLLDRQAAARPWAMAQRVPLRQGDRLLWQTQTWDQLRRRTDALAHGLRRVGVAKGDRVSVFVRPGMDFPAAIFALFKLGASPVFIDPGMGRAAALGCLSRTAPRGLLAVAPLHAASAVFRAAFQSVQVRVTVGAHTGWWGGHTLDAVAALGASDGPFAPEALDPDAEAAVLFTSGSTGPAKGARYTHRIYASQTAFIQQMYGIEPGEVDVPGLSVFGLFSIGMGMTVAWPEIDPTRVSALNPAHLVQLIEEAGATSAFGGIAIWRPVLRWCQANGRTLPSLRRVLSAGTAIPVWMHEGFRAVLAPGVQVHTPYGATESLPVASTGTDEVLGETAAQTRPGRGTCVGRPAPGIAIRVIAVSDAPIATWDQVQILPVGEVGEVAVSGPVVTAAYVDNEDATLQAKILDHSTTPPRIWHRLGDLGYLDAQGRLWFCGRKAHRVETAGGRVCSAPVEEVAVLVPGVARAALVGLGERGHQEPALVVERGPDAGPDLAQRLRSTLSACTFAAPIQRILYHPKLPVDVRHNAKIHNESLAVWAAAEVARAPTLGLEGT